MSSSKAHEINYVIPQGCSRQEFFQCRRKRSYTKEEAKRNAKQTQAKGGGKVNWYKCPWCDVYHIGHTKKST